MKTAARNGQESRRPAQAGTRAGRSRSRKTGAGKRRTGTDRTARGQSAGSRSRTRASAARGSQKSKKKDPSREASEAFVRQNRLSMFLAGLVVLILLIAVAVNAVSLNRKLHENHARAQILQQEIRTEEQRAADIEEYRKYTETDAYIEEVAREKLGLIYEGETVFKEQE